MTSDRPGEALRRASGLLSATVADGVLLIDPTRVRAHGLNASAVAVWARIDGGTDAERVAEQVAGDVGVDVGAVRADVLDAIDHLVTEGLVARGDDEPAPPSGPPRGTFPNVPATDEPVPAGLDDVDWVAHHGPFRGLDVTFDLACTDPDLGRYLADVWAPLALDPTEAVDRVRRYRIVGPHPDPLLDRLLALDDRVVARSRSDAAAAGLAVWHANQLISTETRRFLQIHASAVTFDGRAVLLPAEMNSGKSTLAAALVAGGAGYLTDEAVAIDPDLVLVHPYPKAITLDPGSWPLFAALEPAIHTDLPGLTHGKWYVHPDAIRPGARAPATPPGAIVFPRYAPGTPTAWAALGPVDAAAELARHCFNLATLGQTGVDLVARLATTVACFTLSVHDLPSGVAAVRTLAGA